MHLRRTQAERPESFAVNLIHQFEHLGKPWTQGLEFTWDGQQLIESSGSYPDGTASFVRTLDTQTGDVLMATSDGLDHSAAVAGGRFIEGIVQLQAGSDAHWFATTYEDNIVVEYDAELNLVGEHKYQFEGWGFTRNAERTAFLATNGSAYVMELEPGSFELLSVKTATCMGKELTGINELEMVDDFQSRGYPALLGNLMGTRLVAVLDPATMRCIGAFHLEGLEPEDKIEKMGFHVANGIAFNRHTGNFVVTGKNWANMFEISIESESAAGGGRAVALLADFYGADSSI